MDWAEEIQKRSGYPHLIKSGQHSGLIFLSKYSALESECLIYKTKSPSEDYLRYAHYALFEIGNKRLASFNTHLSWLPIDDEIRYKQTRELLDFAGSKAGRSWKRWFKPYPLIALGDFNSAPNKPSIQAVQAVWEDTFAELNPGAAGLTWDYRNPYAERARETMPERRIDYILTCGLRGRAKRSEVVYNQPDANGTYPSDHFGVITEIEF